MRGKISDYEIIVYGGEDEKGLFKFRASYAMRSHSHKKEVNVVFEELEMEDTWLRFTYSYQGRGTEKDFTKLRPIWEK
jgi:CRISPR/Cas system CSM-associated protein Csm2 small subunit